MPKVRAVLGLAAVLAAAMAAVPAAAAAVHLPLGAAQAAKADVAAMPADAVLGVAMVATIVALGAAVHGAVAALPPQHARARVEASRRKTAILRRAVTSSL